MAAAKSRPSLIDARMDGANQAKLRIQMRHESESGLHRDAQGRPIAASFITEFQLLLNDRPLLTGQLGAGMGRNPGFELRLKGVKAGDKLRLDWTDNRGDKRSDTAAIA